MFEFMNDILNVGDIFWSSSVCVSIFVLNRNPLGHELLNSQRNTILMFLLLF